MIVAIGITQITSLHPSALHHSARLSSLLWWLHLANMRVTEFRNFAWMLVRQVRGASPWCTTGNEWLGGAMCWVLGWVGVVIIFVRSFGGLGSSLIIGRCLRTIILGGGLVVYHSTTEMSRWTLRVAVSTGEILHGMGSHNCEGAVHDFSPI